MINFRVTYDTVTPESAEDGDVSERGYYSPGGWKHDDPSEWTLREVVRHFGRRACEDNGSWFTYHAEQDYRTGEYHSYGIHPPAGISSASYRRLRRLLAGR